MLILAVKLYSISHIVMRIITQFATLCWMLCISIGSSIYRRDLQLTLQFNPEQIAAINDQNLVIAYGNKISVLNGSEFTEIREVAVLSDQASNIPLEIVNGKPTFLSGGSINQLIPDKPAQLNQSVSYVYTNLAGEMRLLGDKMLVPPINYQIKSLFTIDLTKMQVSELNYQPDKYGTVGSSNIVFDEEKAYFASIQSFVGAQIYRKVGNDVVFLCTFPDGYLRTETSYSRDVASLDMKTYQKSKYLMLVWQSRYSTFHNINLAKEIDGTYQSYSRISMQKVVAAHFTDKGTIITYEARYQQIEELDPHTPMALNIMNPGIEYYVYIRDISQSQRYFFGVYAYASSGFALPGYIYKLTQEKAFQKQADIEKSTNGTGFGSGIFVGNDEYIAILDRQEDNTLQVSFYSIMQNTFVDEFAIKNIYNFSKNEGTFCACSNNSRFFVVTVEDGEFYLNLYYLTNGSLSLEDSLLINGSSTLRFHFKCVENDTFIWAIFNANKPYRMILNSYFINEDGFIEEANTIQKELQSGSYSLQAVVNGVLIIMYQDYYPILFFNNNLTELNLAFNISPHQQLKLTKIITYRDDKILIQTDYSFELWTFHSDQLKYLSSFPNIYDNDPTSYGSDFSTKILLPKMNLLLLDCGSTFSFNLDKPPKRRIGYATNDSYPSSFSLQKAKFLAKNDQIYLIVSMYSSQLLILHVISSSVYEIQRVDQPLNNIKRLRLSSDKQWVIVLGEGNSFMIVNSSNLRYTEYLASMKYSSYYQYLNDLDYVSSTGQIVSLSKKITDSQSAACLRFIVSQANIQKIGVDSSLTSVTTVAFGNQNMVYSGLTSDGSNADFFLMQDLKLPSKSKTYAVNCRIKLLAISPTQDIVAGVCSNQSIFVFVRISERLYNFPTTGSITKISFLNENKLVVNSNGILMILKIDLSASDGNSQISLSLRQISGALQNSTFAIDYNNGILAYQTFTTIRFVYIDSEQIINEIPTYRSNMQVLALAFNPNGDILYASLLSNRSSYSQFNTYTSQPCPENFTLNAQGLYCECKKTFISSGSLCICPSNLVIINSSCSCRESYILWNSVCRCPETFVEANNSCVCPESYILNGSYCRCPNNQIYIYQIKLCGCEQSHLKINETCSCPNNLVELNNAKCGCKAPFIANNSFCVCQDGKGLINNGTYCRLCSGNEKLKDSYCQCKSGYTRFEDSTICDPCSFFCSQCSSLDSFDCQTYSIGFYVIVVAASLILIGLSIIIINRCRNSLKKQQSQLTQNMAPSSGRQISTQNII